MAIPQVIRRRGYACCTDSDTEYVVSCGRVLKNRLFNWGWWDEICTSTSDVSERVVFPRRKKEMKPPGKCIVESLDKGVATLPYVIRRVILFSVSEKFLYRQPGRERHACTRTCTTSINSNSKSMIEDWLPIQTPTIRFCDVKQEYSTHLVAGVCCEGLWSFYAQELTHPVPAIEAEYDIHIIYSIYL